MYTCCIVPFKEINRNRHRNRTGVGANVQRNGPGTSQSGRELGDVADDRVTQAPPAGAVEPDAADDTEAKAAAVKANVERKAPGYSSVFSLTRYANKSALFMSACCCSGVGGSLTAPLSHCAHSAGTECGS